jgi:hypothetical protein
MPKSQSRAGVGFYSHEVQKTLMERAQEPETKLWRAVLSQALDDAFGPPKYDKRKEDVEEARSFLKDTNNFSFTFICENAELDPNYVKYKLEKKFKEG